MNAAKAPLTRYRLVGFLPLLLFVARYIELQAQGKTPHLLWVCHLSSLVIALGLFLGWIELVRVSTLWLIIGIPIWPIEIVRTGIMELTSIGTHYVSLIIGLLVIRRQGMGRFSWLYGLIWFLGLQQVTRLGTPPELNVNLAHAVYPGWERAFPAYWQYWLFTIAAAGLCLWLSGRLLSAYFVRPRAGHAIPQPQL